MANKEQHKAFSNMACLVKAIDVEMPISFLAADGILSCRIRGQLLSMHQFVSGKPREQRTQVLYVRIMLLVTRSYAIFLLKVVSSN